MFFFICMVLLALVSLGALFSPPGERIFNAFWLFCVAISLSTFGAIVYVAHHFIVKYW